MKAVDLKAVQFLLYKFAYLVMDFPEIKAIDINPYGVDHTGGVVLDAKVVLEEKYREKEPVPYSHMVISPYPKKYIKSITLKNGQPAMLRPIKPEDEALEAEMIDNFSEQTFRFRFFENRRRVTHQMLVRYTHIDYDREIAIVAIVEDEGKEKMAGVVRIIADADNEKAEYAIAIADPWHNQGLGNELTNHIIDIAQRRNIHVLSATLLKENRKMLHMFEKRGFVKVDSDEDCFYMEKDLWGEEVYS
jgi:acetyltransferase